MIATVRDLWPILSPPVASLPGHAAHHSGRDDSGFVVLVNDRPVEDLEDLEDRLTLDEAAEVAFVRLVSLVGG